MPLNAGTRLASYEIGVPIGAGGMGEVYRARDTRLHRDVAIKVLPEHLARDPAALARFEREAQAVAALSHPNILAIHDFGVAADSHVAYAVTELLEGETLRARLSGGALPTRKAVEYALQIVHGIAAAHQKGVIHRDLKPENVFVTQDGRVKILDFGLAKAMEPSADGATGLTQSATGTSPGTVMGTVGYMSPEQVRGIPVDHRTDIFSFGVILYEMLSGLRAFRGDSNVETMNAILKEDPPELTAAGASVPASLDRIVRRCIEKSPDERFHSAHDLGLALETLGASSTASGQSAASIAVGPLAPTRRRWVPWLLAAAGVAIAAGAFFAGRSAGAPHDSEVPNYRRVTFQQGSLASARYAGDGKTIVYSASWNNGPRRLYTTREESPDSMLLPFPEADITSVSPSGELALVINRRPIRGWARVGTLARASLAGSAAREVLTDVQDADWLPDGTGFVASRYVDGRYRIEFPAGKTVYETSGYVSDVRVSPDGGLVAFVDHPSVGDDRGSVAVVDRAGVKRTLSPEYSSAQGVAWARQGAEIWFTGADRGSARTLFAATRSGQLRIVARTSASLRLADVGADGSVLVWHDNTRSGLSGRAPGEAAERELSWLDWSTLPALSPDGRTLLFTEQGDGGGAQYSIYLRAMDGSPAVRLGEGAGMSISPDGKWVLALRLNPPPAQYVLLPTGAGEGRVLTNDAITHDLGRFTADGKHIVFGGSAPDRPSRLFRQDLAGGAASPITPEGVTGLLSPDETLVAFEGKHYPVGGGDPRPIPGFTPGDRFVGWAADSRSGLVLRTEPLGDSEVFRLDPGGRRTLLHRIPHISGAGVLGWFVITPDGAGYVYSYTVAQTDLFRVTGLR